ncbi:enolase C-terminal domain-like protein [Streptomyces cucumeris]|uniref:enolase C-terminal domain-like protein n=1 Tax=Streptomyces cucumeris TaxID=2962890 RepID=UPI003EB7295E
MKITGLSATTVTLDLEAPLRHSNGAHWGRFVRTLVEVHTDEGISGLGELGGGGQSAEAALKSLEPYLIGHDPHHLEALQLIVANPTASLYNNRTQLLAALEFACLDIIGKAANLPVHALLGGKLRDRVPFASYLFFRYPNPDGSGEIRTAEQLLEHAADLRARHGFTSHKLKGGVYPPEYELDVFRELAHGVEGQPVRYDPNCVLSLAQARRFAAGIADLNNDYLEDPTWGLNGLRQLRRDIAIPLATNTVVVNPEQLACNLRDPAVDVILLDTTFWGGIRACLKAAATCATFQQPVGVHSSGELGVQLATMLHFGAVLPNFTYSADSHYHHLRDDIIVGGKFRYVDGAITVPDGPGLGVTLDRDKVEHYAARYRELGDYPYDRDPTRPGWYPHIPNHRWADPTRTARPADFSPVSTPSDPLPRST